MRSVVLHGLALAMLVVSLGCGDELLQPTIVNLTVTPDALNLNETGMTDEFINVEISVANFSADPESARVFVQDPERDAVPMNTTITGQTIQLTGITKTWFEGFDAGVYNIGAAVESPNETITQLDLATVTLSQ